MQRTELHMPVCVSLVVGFETRGCTEHVDGSVQSGDG